MKADDPMRILMMDKYLTVGGVATFLKTLGTELLNQGHKVYLITASDEQNAAIIQEFESCGVRVIHFPDQKNNLLNAVQFLKHSYRFIKQHPVDILHSHHRLVNFVGILLKKLLSIPHLITFHVIKDDHKLLHKLWKKEAIVVPSQASKEHIVRNYQLDEKRVKVIHNAISPDFDVDAAQAKILEGKMFNKADDFYVGYIGRLSKEKGVDVLLDSIPLVQTECPEVEFRIFGDGEERAVLEKRCRDNGLNPGTIFQGKTPHVNELLTLMDVCVIPSRSESFGLFALECMRAGKPVIASSVGGLQEIISPGKTGILFEPGDPKVLAEKILALYKDRKLAARLAKNSQEQFHRKFTLDSFYKYYVDQYRHLISE